MKNDNPNARRAGLAMSVIGIVIAVVAVESSWRTFPLLLLAAAFVCGGVAIWAQNRPHVEGEGTGFRFQPLTSEHHFERPAAGADYGKSAMLAQVPNLPIAEMVCQELRANGIEAFYKGARVMSGFGYGVASANPAIPVEIWVGESDLAEARRFLPQP